ncbi:SDR family NAD(P)-dependent oxidoreductase [Plantactinospora sp. CA-290183]|uniref:SDR family NAD(P)-dependent oxidoreductase n=1 Tax=Plantactinospora sp. CA-290183 TaxID=3240006 RepID=UPI003D8CB4DF
MSFDLTGMRALVTGSGHGIGAAVAVALATAGADVVVHYGRSADAAARTVGRIEALGRKATAVAADVTVTAEVDRLVDEAVGFLGGLDILVCNAGHMVGRVPVASMTDEHFARVVDVNLGATFRTVRAAMPHLKAAGRRGRIVTMSSLAAHNGGGPGSAVYAAAKAGVRGLTKGLAKELAVDGVTVNALAPGFIGQTAFHDTFTAPAAQEAIISGVPLRRAGTPDEVAATVVWLCSAAAGYVTGSTVDIDGGAWFR